MPRQSMPHRPMLKYSRVVDLAYYCWAIIVFRTNNQTVNDGVAHSKNPKKCAYHVTFDLDLDVEHTLDACWPGVHHVQIWSRSGHLSARISDLRKSLQTDTQTDRRTDGGRRAIALAHSWNELKMSPIRTNMRSSREIKFWLRLFSTAERIHCQKANKRAEI